MGNTVSTYFQGQGEDVNKSPTVNHIDDDGKAIAGDKNTHYKVPESIYDSIAISEDDYSFHRIDYESLFGADLKKVGNEIIEALKKDNVIVLRTTGDVYNTTQSLRDCIEDYLSLSLEDKKKLGKPHVKDGYRAYYSGYSQIHFENRDNIRDPEWRDVFQVRLAEAEEDHIPWPNETFKKSALAQYDSQWLICLQFLRAIAAALEIPVDRLFETVGGSSPVVNDADGADKAASSSAPAPEKSINTNLSLFHYYDLRGEYSVPQRCMVHNDNGLVTLLPRSSVPGLELLHPTINKWIQAEKMLNDDDILVFGGLALQIMTGDKITAARHRVVRFPNNERYSMPFEMKPNDDAVMSDLTSSEAVDVSSQRTFDGMSKQITWQKLQLKVRRADGIAPGSQEEAEILSNMGQGSGQQG